VTGASAGSSFRSGRSSSCGIDLNTPSGQLHYRWAVNQTVCHAPTAELAESHAKTGTPEVTASGSRRTVKRFPTQALPEVLGQEAGKMRA
jgi:hypothetical protein